MHGFGGSPAAPAEWSPGLCVTYAAVNGAANAIAERVLEEPLRSGIVVPWHSIGPRHMQAE